MLTNEVPSRAAQSVLLHAARFHAAHTPSPHDLRLLELSHMDLFWKFLIEKKAKNKAYEFIMRAGLLDAFYEHCTGEKPNHLSSPKK